MLTYKVYKCAIHNVIFFFFLGIKQGNKKKRDDQGGPASAGVFGLRLRVRSSHLIQDPGQSVAGRALSRFKGPEVGMSYYDAMTLMDLLNT